VVGHSTVKSIESQLIFKKNMSPPSSGSKNKPRKKPVGKQVARRLNPEWATWGYTPEGILHTIHD
jgi:hypothetical protein